MQTTTHDSDSGVVDQDCRPLNAETVFTQLAFHERHGLFFMGKPPHFWRDLVVEQAQQIADEADPDEYEFWGIKYMEQP
ncbi:MAG: hypothetical protein WBF88_17665 [Pusillimonas sp.]